MGSVCITVRAPMSLPSGLPTGTPGEWHLYAKVNREVLLGGGKNLEARPEGWGEAEKGALWAETTAKAPNGRNQHFPRRAKMSCWLEHDVLISSRTEIPTHEWSFEPHINYSIAQMLLSVGCCRVSQVSLRHRTCPLICILETFTRVISMARWLAEYREGMWEAYILNLEEQTASVNNMKKKSWRC